MSLQNGGGKIPGKAEYARRRRNATRQAGFHAHAGSTGGHVKTISVPVHLVSAGHSLSVIFSMKSNTGDTFIGYGGWFCLMGNSTVTISGGEMKRTLTQFRGPDWNKFGSMWRSLTAQRVKVTINFAATEDCRIAFHELKCGTISHEHIDGARAELLTNMHQFSPEAHFFLREGTVEFVVDSTDAPPPSRKDLLNLVLKSCNRCARFLPINVPNERNHLSFSNHCVARHRRPCSHSGFGKLRDPETGDVTRTLEYGFQLECRFCKKFEVNAAHNPQRTAAQMKEDAARRRGFELLIESLCKSKSTPQLSYRHRAGRELCDEVYSKFGGKCFSCGTPLHSCKKMHLDHTRPLALLWPLDEYATALCAECNSQKRDRTPQEFYSKTKLRQLARKVGLPIADLRNPSPNMKIIKVLLSELDWFFNEFLKSEDMARERDGKVTGELVVKALQKVLEKCPRGAPVDLISRYRNKQ